MFLCEGTIKYEERRFLYELKGEAGHVSAKFEVRIESMNQPSEQCNCELKGSG